MYHAPLKDLRFVLEELFGTAALSQLPRYRDFSNDLAVEVLDQAAKFAQDILLPLNRTGDSAGAVWRDGAVQMSAGFRNAYQRYVEAGWPALTATGR